MNIGNTLIIFGILIVLLGLVLTVLERFGFPKLPGDILIRRDGLTVYFPIVSMILLSIVLTIVVNLFRK